MKKFLFFLMTCSMPIFSTIVTIDSPENLPPQEEVIQEIPANYKHIFFKTLLLIIGSLSAVFILMLLLKRFSAIRYSGLNRESHIQVIERRPISSKSTLYLVQIGNQKVMIAESHLEIKKITELDLKSID